MFLPVSRFRILPAFVHGRTGTQPPMFASTSESSPGKNLPMRKQISELRQSTGRHAGLTHPDP